MLKFHTFWLDICKLIRIRIRFRIHLIYFDADPDPVFFYEDADPDPGYQYDADPSGSESITLLCTFKYLVLVVCKSEETLLKHVFHCRMTSTIKYYKCEEIFAELPLWKAVPDSEREPIKH